MYYPTYQRLFLVVSSLLFIPPCSADKYLLVFGIETQGSHMISMTTAAKAMIEHQHNVTLVLPSGRDASIRKVLSNLTYVSEYYEASIPAQKEREDMLEWSKLILNGTYLDIIKFGSGASKKMQTYCEDVLRDVSLLQRLEERQFDLVFVHNVFACPVLIAQHLGLRFVTFFPGIPPSGTMRGYSNPVNPAYSPELFTGYSDRMSFLQRVQNTLYSAFHWQLTKLSYRHLDELKIKYDIKPKLSTLDTLSQAEILFITSDFVLDFPRPYQPNVVSVGGLTANPAQALPKVRS